MRYVWLVSLLAGGCLFAGTQDSEFNVNTHYTVETVLVSGDGWTANVTSPAECEEKFSSTLRKDIAALIGEKLNPPALDELARRLRKEFHARTVEHHVLRGKSPEYVQVVFEIQLRPSRFDVSVPKFLYSGKQGWSGAVEGTATVKHNGFTVGLVTDADEITERYTGIVARYDNSQVGSDRLRFRFQVESYHEQWNASTLNALASQPAAAADTSGLYRTRQSFEPELTFAIAKPVTLSFGASFQNFQEESPAAPTDSANALFTTLRFHRRIEDADNQSDLDGSYNLRAASRLLNSDFVYARHRWEFRYMLTRGKNVVIDDVTGGLMTGRAPLFERFVLGNSTSLRGWNKYEVDPLGGNRMVHNAVEYRYGAFQIFYDAGAVWDSNETAILRHSIGVGLRQGVFSLAVAFPVREGHVDPIFMVGMNY